MQKIINDLLTGKDNKTHDIGRWSLVFSMFTFVFACLFNAIHGGTVELEKLYMGMSAIVGAHGAAMLMKRDTEPTGKEE